jgi:hypothetical protein
LVLNKRRLFSFTDAGSDAEISQVLAQIRDFALCYELNASNHDGEMGGTIQNTTQEMENNE